jgi:hypothetical protein
MSASPSFRIASATCQNQPEKQQMQRSDERRHTLLNATHEHHDTIPHTLYSRHTLMKFIDVHIFHTHPFPSHTAPMLNKPPHLWCVNAVGGAQRDGHLSLHTRCDPSEGPSGHHGCDGGDARLVPPYACTAPNTQNVTYPVRHDNKQANTWTW